MIKKHMIIFKRLQPVKEIITHPAAYCIRFISKYIGRYKPQKPDPHPRANQQINFTENLDREINALAFSIIVKAKENTFKIFIRMHERIINLVCFNIKKKMKMKMTQYSTLNVRLSNSQLNKNVKLGIKKGTQVTLNLSSNVVDNYNDQANFSHRLYRNYYKKFQRFIKLLQIVQQLI